MTVSESDSAHASTLAQVSGSDSLRATERLQVSVSHSLAAALRERAELVGVSVSALVAVLLDLALDAELTFEPKAERPAPAPAPAPAPQLIRTPEQARERVSTKAQACPAFTPVGTRCKVCGNVHKAA